MNQMIIARARLEFHNLAFFFVILLLFYFLLYYLHTQKKLTAYILSGIISVPFLFGTFTYTEKETAISYLISGLFICMLLHYVNKTMFEGYEYLFLISILGFVQSYFPLLHSVYLVFLACLWAFLCVMNYLNPETDKGQTLTLCFGFYLASLFHLLYSKENLFLLCRGGFFLLGCCVIARFLLSRVSVSFPTNARVEQTLWWITGVSSIGIYIFYFYQIVQSA